MAKTVVECCKPLNTSYKSKVTSNVVGVLLEFDHYVHVQFMTEQSYKQLIPLLQKRCYPSELFARPFKFKVPYQLGGDVLAYNWGCRNKLHLENFEGGFYHYTNSDEGKEQNLHGIWKKIFPAQDEYFYVRVTERFFKGAVPE